MARRRLLWQLYPSYLAIALISVTAVAGYAIKQFRDFYLQQTVNELTARSLVFQGYLSLNVKSNRQFIDKICKQRGKAAATRFTIILADGKVIGDSEKNPDLMDNHAQRPEVKKALLGKIGWSIRRSNTLKKNMVYVATPFYEGKTITAVVRASIPVALFDKTLQLVYSNITQAGVLVAVLVAIWCYFVSKKLTRPLEEMKHGILAFAKGDFSQKIFVPDSEEMGILAEAANEMAQELDSRIKTITQRKNEQESILTSMVEGVFAVDMDERIVHLNRAAENIVGCKSEEVIGRFTQEVIRNPELQDFIEIALESSVPTEGDLVWHNEHEDRFFQARGTALTNAESQSVGAVIVLNEVTRLYRLERVRRDFVANVSHELRTPITAIRGFGETLLESCEDDDEQTKRFLNIIIRQSNRLNAIIEDLLILSRIEKQAEKSEIKFSSGSVKSVLKAAIQSCEVQAAEKNILIHLVCSKQLTASMNDEMMERAVVNLLDNAIKYSAQETEVIIEALEVSNEIQIKVQDQGDGITPEHHERLFERFYRVDKARSRSVGGTGLGLAIVKHIAQAHNGKVTVESVKGTGSIFIIYFPAKKLI